MTLSSCCASLSVVRPPTKPTSPVDRVATRTASALRPAPTKIMADAACFDPGLAVIPRKRKNRSRANSPLRYGPHSATLSHVTKPPTGSRKERGTDRP